MSDKNTKASVFYGRARRLELYEKITYIVVGLIAIALVVFLVSSQSSNGEANINYYYLKQHFYNRGFSCDMVHKSGGKCRKSNEKTLYVFTRYDDGFEYLVETESYLLKLSHSLKNENYISFETTSEAFSGYRNKEYMCKFEKNVIGKLGECTTKNGEKLELNSYIGVIEQAQIEVSNAIDSSGYYRKILLDDYQWVKK